MRASDSLLGSLRSLEPAARAAALASLTDQEALALLYDWRGLWARPEQLLPADDGWDTWLILSGRGWGKTRTGVEAVLEWTRTPRIRIALVGRTAADVRDVIVEGESGILACAPPWFRPVYEPSKRQLTWPNGTIAKTYSADEPSVLRGPQHHKALCDELASWKHVQETWDNLQLGLRLGSHPQAAVTTTPRPIKLIRQLLQDLRCRVTRGSTYDNAANLPAVFLRAIREKYEGTRLGRQELHGEVLDDIPGALWTRAMVDAHRRKAASDLVRVVVALDPAVTSGEDSDMTGIVVTGKTVLAEYEVLADLSCRLSPDGWANRAIDAFVEHQADLIVGEVNNGGDLVERVIANAAKARGINVAFEAVHASRGKRVRAEPIAALYEQGKVHHVGQLDDLEDQMCMFTPENIAEISPDRVDALVWGLTQLSEGHVVSYDGVPEIHAPRRM